MYSPMLRRIDTPWVTVLALVTALAVGTAPALAMMGMVVGMVVVLIMMVHMVLMLVVLVLVVLLVGGGSGMTTMTMPIVHCRTLLPGAITACVLVH
jgi:hypothetical protein